MLILYGDTLGSRHPMPPLKLYVYSLMYAYVCTDHVYSRPLSFWLQLCISHNTKLFQLLPSPPLQSQNQTQATLLTEAEQPKMFSVRVKLFITSFIGLKCHKTP